MGSDPDVSLVCLSELVWLCLTLFYPKKQAPQRKTARRLLNVTNSLFFCFQARGYRLSCVTCSTDGANSAAHELHARSDRSCGILWLPSNKRGIEMRCCSRSSGSSGGWVARATSKSSRHPNQRREARYPSGRQEQRRAAVTICYRPKERMLLHITSCGKLSCGTLFSSTATQAAKAGYLWIYLIL